MKIKCDVCGEICEAKQARRRFCSTKCRNKYFRTMYAPRPKEKPVHVKIAKVNLTPAQQNDGYKNIRAAIIEQAIHDYRAALMSGNGGKAFSLERWFLSEWGQALSEYNGDKIIARVRKECKKGLKNDR